MPSYEYVCETCGEFEVSRPIAEAALPRACPECGRPAPRALASPHFRSSRARNDYVAETRNEKSAHEPMTEHRLKSPTAHSHAHGKLGHGTHGHGARPQAHGHGAQRPWMIGH